ncbi:MAG: MBL fold metallo-hydrolase [Planctomycetaceae bacterium]
MRVQFLGTGGYHPNERRHTACIHLPGTGVVFDAGTAAFRLASRLERHEIDLFLSHAHLDHIVGLTYLLVPLLRGTLKRVRLYGTQGTLKAVRDHLFAEPTFPIRPAFEFSPLEDFETIALQDGGVLTHRILASHPGGSTAFRIDWPPERSAAQRSLAYVTDTAVDGTYLDFVRGVDVLIHECYFPDDLADWAAKTGHSHTTPVAQLARDTRVGKLILMHIDPERETLDPVCIQTARALHPDTLVAEDGMEIAF